MAPMRILLVYLGWALLWSVIQVMLLVWSVGLQWQIAAADGVIMNLFLAAGGYAMSTGLQFYQPSLKQGAYLLGWSMGMAGICLLLFDFIIGKLYANHILYLNFVDATLPVRMVFAWLMMLLMLLLSWMWYYTQGRRQDEELKATTEKLAREAELYSLRQQLQPHFLFNSLNSINALVGSRPEQARTMIHQLSEFLRGTLRKDNLQKVSLADELKQLELYLEIEKVRFGHRLQTTIQIQDDSKEMYLPALLLQPVVENAIKFGLYDTTGDSQINIKARAVNKQLELEVHNPFDPTTVRPNRGTGFGLSSIQRRLYLIYARQDLLSTQQQGHTFITTIKIPQ